VERREEYLVAGPRGGGGGLFSPSNFLMASPSDPSVEQVYMYIASTSNEQQYQSANVAERIRSLVLLYVVSFDTKIN
jgi:hypothetical protein